STTHQVPIASPDGDAFLAIFISVAELKLATGNAPAPLSLAFPRYIVGKTKALVNVTEDIETLIEAPPLKSKSPLCTMNSSPQITCQLYTAAPSALLPRMI